MNNLNSVLDAFDFKGRIKNAKDFGNGHINDTYRLNFSSHEYILQRINDDVFQRPDQLMENIENVTEHLKKKIIMENGDPKRETLSVIKTKKGSNYYKDSLGNFWRAYEFIDNSVSYDSVKDPQDFYQAGLAFGNFQKRLEDFPIDKLHYTIENFHNTPVRFQTFLEAVDNNYSGRKNKVQEEISFVKGEEKSTHILWDHYKNGALSLKVTHNDTKLNNVLMDKATGQAICVVDLDTVMPGFALDDFGDSIRFGASTAKEDERDLRKVNLDLQLYEAYVQGFIQGSDGSLSRLEIELFPEAARVLTLETGMRFLTDYLDGDLYFKTAYSEHNLVRARTQFKLVREIDKHWDQLKEISSRYL